MADAKEEEYWIFGYGSLIWKPPPHFDLRIPGFITGYVRRFWQASQDHRGTPTAPGRVVTLIERSFWETLGDETTEGGPTAATTTTTTTKEGRVHGAAYRIPRERVPEVQSYLDLREINGYSIRCTTFFPSPSPSPSAAVAAVVNNCLVYIGLPSNPQFLGRQAPQDVAEVIARSEGPSGANAEYLFMLEDALMELGDDGSEDDHVRDLAARVKALMKKKKKGGDGKREENKEVETQAVENEVQRLRSGGGGQAGEETEKTSPA